MPCTSTPQGPNTSGQGWRSRAFGTARTQGFCLFLHLPNAKNAASQKGSSSQNTSFCFSLLILTCSVPKSMASFLLIDPICSKQIQIVGTCYHILYQKSSWIFCDTAPANVSVVNSSMMHFERGKKHTSHFLQPFCCCFHAQGTTLESGSSFFLCLFIYC